MSWFTDLAGKAESLLEKVDTVAATALTKDQVNQDPSGLNQGVIVTGPTVNPAPIQRTTPGPFINQGLDIPRAATSESSVLGGPTVPIKSRPPSGTRTPPRVTRTENKNDDKLFEFLNSNIPASKERKPVKPKVSTDSSSELVTKPSDSVDLVQGDVADGRVGEGPVAKSTGEGETIANISNGPGVEEPHSLDMLQHDPHAGSQHHAGDDRLSNLELENTLLRKEVSSLNEEMVSVVQRAKEAERRVKEGEKQLQRSQNQLSTSEDIARQLRMKEEDFTEALNAKDSQLAVLRVRIQESDQELQSKRQQIDEYQLERERLLQDHSASTGVHSHALDTLKAKLEEAESKLKTGQESQNKMEEESMDRQTKLQQEQAAMAESLKNMQKKINEEKNKSNGNTVALKTAKANLETAKQDLKDYKDKAARILQAKDKVIASLRDGSNGDVTNGISSSEYEEVCHERDMFKDEVNQIRYKMEQLKADLQDLEQQQQSEAELAREKVEELESALDDEKRKKEACEQQIQQHLQDLHLAQDEVQGTKTTFMSQIQERENDIQKLRNQLATKALTSTSEEELGNRVRALTENLIQKQTLIEALSTEKNSLVLQLERLEKQYRDVQASTSKMIPGPSASYDGFDDTDENTLSRVRSISSIMPSQLNDSRKVKRAVNEIDKFSIRLGLFLRRYPIARLFVIIYMVLLHIWVLIVLLTYQPEVHHTTSSNGLPRPPK
ncbi:Golgin sub A member 5 [Desmophyllum pertusum]|uniref:Golgin sub A member 5 n=1 Tax=Desmophyllum pertusum TaxID=174260 RepID=A0A9X0CPB6_9CNID|nr:Golgin sub A member 5 [Desmophyllum pertusum]